MKMKKTTVILVISIILNLVFITIFYNNYSNDRDNTRILLDKYIEHLKFVSVQLNVLTLNAESNHSEDLELNRDTFYDLKEIEQLLLLNEDLFINHLVQKKITPDLRQVNMEGIKLFPMLWHGLYEDPLVQDDKLEGIREYNKMLQDFFTKLNDEYDYENVSDLDEKIEIVNKVSNEVLKVYSQ